MFTKVQINRLTTMQDVSGETTMVYDPRSSLTGKTDSNGMSLAYGYDPVGNRTSMTDADGGVYNYGYDAGNRLVSITNPFAENTVLGYDAVNQLIKKQFGSGCVENTIYDAAGRMTFRGAFDPMGNLICSFATNYDNAGNRLGVYQGDGTRLAYSYDDAYQLTNETRVGSFPYNTSYQYDPVGNRTSMIDSGAVTNYYCDLANRLTTIIAPDSSVTYQTFDANGNLTVINAAGSLATNTWDTQNRLSVRALPDGSVTTFVRNANGQRMTADISGGAPGVYSLTWDGDNLLRLAVNSGGPTVVVRQTNYPGYWGGLISSHFYASGVIDITAFNGYDLQGSAVAQVEGSGQLISPAAYKSYGEILQELFFSFFGFGALVGYFTDDADHLQLGARVLNPPTGRFITEDRIGRRSGRSLYPYVGNRPTVRVDPSGLQTIISPTAGGFPSASSIALGNSIFGTGSPGLNIYGTYQSSPNYYNPSTSDGWLGQIGVSLSVAVVNGAAAVADISIMLDINPDLDWSDWRIGISAHGGLGAGVGTGWTFSPGLSYNPDPLPLGYSDDDGVQAAGFTQMFGPLGTSASAGLNSGVRMSNGTICLTPNTGGFSAKLGPTFGTAGYGDAYSGATQGMTLGQLSDFLNYGLTFGGQTPYEQMFGTPPQFVQTFSDFVSNLPIFH